MSTFFASPTSSTVPQSASDCHSPIDCIIFLMHNIVELRKKSQKKSKNKSPARKTVARQELVAAAGSLFGDRGSPELWVADSIEEAVRLRILKNQNEGLVNIQPLYTLLLEGVQQFAATQVSARTQDSSKKAKSNKKRAKKSSDQRIASTTRKLSRVHKSIVKKRLSLRKKR